MDVRPTHPAILQLLIQEFEERFAENVDETREEILNIIAEVLGAPDESQADKVAAAREEANKQREADKNAPPAEEYDEDME